MKVNCCEERDKMILFALRKKLQLAAPGTDDHRDLEQQIQKLEEKLGLA